MTTETAKEMLMNNKEMLVLVSDYAVCMDSKTEVEEAITTLYGNKADLYTLLSGLCEYAAESGRILSRLNELGMDKEDIEAFNLAALELERNS